MKEKLKTKAKEIKDNPKVQEAVKSMKPDKSIWGFLGVVVFFILPEVVAFIWGEEITAYAKGALLANPPIEIQYYYDALVMLFEDGGSWINLAIGFALLAWLFF